MIEGIIGKKLGMTQLYKENGVQEPVTAIEVGPCAVTQIKTNDKDGYTAVQLGFGQAKKLSSPERGHIKGLDQFRYLREFRLDKAEGIKVGDKIDASVFKAGDLVDVTGISRGKGFAGVVKRYHFRGGPKTHGQSDRTRHPGAIGSTTYPGRVWKGTRMAGHMGNDQVTVKNLEVFQASPDRNLLLVKGAVPGAKNSLVIIKKSGRSK
jgi:large subunit ribosomal protein L3